MLVRQDLRLREQCISARNRANRVLGFIISSVSNRSADVILTIYLALDIGKNWFTIRIVEEWNKLSKHVVSAGTVDTLRKD